jgi:hypothetical protein
MTDGMSHMEVFSKEHEYSARLRVYYHPASDASRKVLLTAAHLGIDVDLRIVDAKRLAHRTADYLKINPNGLFPVLIEDDFVLWESTAIMQYLAWRCPASRRYNAMAMLGSCTLGARFAPAYGRTGGQKAEGSR